MTGTRRRRSSSGNVETANDFPDIYYSCKMGLPERVQYFVEVKRVDVNRADYFNATPLYYASLCGHHKIVKYLLEHGARCDQEAFEGERALYAALTPAIGVLLKTYNISIAQRDPYLEFLRTAFEAHDFYNDIEFQVHGELLNAHRVVLASRSSYMCQLLSERWAAPSISINHSRVHPEAFRHLLKYIYTGSLDIQYEYWISLKSLLRQCQLTELFEEVKDSRERIQSMRQMTLEPQREKDRIRDSFYAVFYAGCPPEVRADYEQPEEEVFERFQTQWPVSLRTHPPYFDVKFNLQGRVFLAHKIFLCGRSDYFKAFLSGQFNESTSGAGNDGTLDVEIHDLSPTVFAAVLEFVYTDKVINLDYALAEELIAAADLFLMDNLKTLSTTSLMQYADPDNVFHLLEISRTYGLARLESKCIDVLALNLPAIIHEPRFVDMVVESAASIRNRESVDSIPVVDELREALGRLYATNRDPGWDIDEPNELEQTRQTSMELLDGMLNRLGLQTHQLDRTQ